MGNTLTPQLPHRPHSVLPKEATLPLVSDVLPEMHCAITGTNKRKLVLVFFSLHKM